MFANSGRFCRRASVNRELSFSDSPPSVPENEVEDEPETARLKSTEDLVAELTVARPAFLHLPSASVLPASVTVVPRPNASGNVNDEPESLSQMEEASSMSEQAWDPYQVDDCCVATQPCNPLEARARFDVYLGSQLHTFDPNLSVFFFE